MKVVLIILDGVGIGALPDAPDYGDAGADTLGNLSRARGGLRLPNLQRLGLGNIADIAGVPPAARPEASFGRMAEMSPAKDSTSGHWEIACQTREAPPAVYPDGFPPDVVSMFAEKTRWKLIGNKAASGTAIIDELGAEHLRTGRPIVYTSADSVFQIAAHKDVMPVEELYRVCRVVREEIMNGRPRSVDRVIARPFEGEPGAFRRTRLRRDFSIPPPYPTLLDMARAAGVFVFGIGKVDDLFGGRGFDDCVHTSSNADGIERLRAALLEKRPKDNRMLIFANLIDFDQEHGHRRNEEGFAKALEEFDAALPGLLAGLGPDDMAAATADHGCDPTLKRHTDHTREYVPLLVAGGGAGKSRPLGTRESFADLGASVAAFLGLPPAPRGIPFLPAAVD